MNTYEESRKLDITAWSGKSRQKWKERVRDSIGEREKEHTVHYRTPPYLNLLNFIIPYLDLPPLTLIYLILPAP